MKFPETIKRLRKRKGVTQEQAAAHIGVGRSTYAKYETGDSEPNYEILNRLSEYFEVSVDELLGRSSRHITKQDQQEDLTETPLTPEEVAAIERIKNDPEAQIAFKDFLSAPIKKQRSMLKAWEAFKNMDDN